MGFDSPSLIATVGKGIGPLTGQPERRGPLPQGKGEAVGRKSSYVCSWPNRRLPIETLSLYFRVAQIIGEQCVPFSATLGH